MSFSILFKASLKVMGEFESFKSLTNCFASYLQRATVLPLGNFNCRMFIITLTRNYRCRLTTLAIRVLEI